MEAEIRIGELNTCVDCGEVRIARYLDENGLPLCGLCTLARIPPAGIVPALAAETLRQAQDENTRLREALWDAYGFLVNLYCHDSNYPEVKRFLDKIEAVMPEVKPE